MTERQKQAQIDLHRGHANNYNRVRRELVGTRLMNEYWNREIHEWLPEDPKVRFLDNMCGTGVFLDSLVSRYSSVVGADISVDMLQLTLPETRRRVQALVGADAERLPFEDGSFDAVNIRGALHHVNPVDTALGEVHRVLKPGGTFVVSEPCDDFVLVRKARERMYRKLDYFDEEEKTFLSRRLIEAIERTGFKIRRTKRFGFLAYTLLGYPDVIPALEFINHLPLAGALSRGLILMDRLLARVPVVRNWSLVVFVQADKA